MANIIQGAASAPNSRRASAPVETNALLMSCSAAGHQENSAAGGQPQRATYAAIARQAYRAALDLHDGSRFSAYALAHHYGLRAGGVW